MYETEQAQLNRDSEDLPCGSGPGTLPIAAFRHVPPNLF